MLKFLVTPFCRSEMTSVCDDGDEDKKKTFPFHEMGFDDRILKAIAKLGWINPTLIQERAIPLIIEGKDLLARGRTGSGKTGAFCIPLIQRILEVKSSSSSAGSVQVCMYAILLISLKSVLIVGSKRLCLMSQSGACEADFRSLDRSD